MVLQPGEQQRFYKGRPGEFALPLDKTVFFANSSALSFKTCCNFAATLEKTLICLPLCLVVVKAIMR